MNWQNRCSKWPTKWAWMCTLCWASEELPGTTKLTRQCSEDAIQASNASNWSSSPSKTPKCSTPESLDFSSSKNTKANTSQQLIKSLSLTFSRYSTFILSWFTLIAFQRQIVVWCWCAFVRPFYCTELHICRYWSIIRQSNLRNVELWW